MAKKQKELSDDELLSRVEQKVRQSIGYYDSRLSKERQRVIEYYNSILPKRQNEGRSSYITSDVYDSVEGMKAQILETFSGNPDNLISFPPRHDKDMEGCRIATEVANQQIWGLNEGHTICHDVLHDGFTARIGVVKVYWDERHEDTEESFDGLGEHDVHALTAQEDIVELDAEETAPGSGQYGGTLMRREDHSQVAIDPLPPEEFLIEQRAKSVAKAGFTCHRTLKTKAELKREGYDPKIVDQINWEDARSLDLTGEQIVRNQPVSDGIAPIDDSIQPEMQKVMVYECYARMDMYDGSGVKLWKIAHAGHFILDREEVDRAPFVVFVPLRVSHVFHGNNFAYRVLPTQNARTVLTRAILDHAAVTTNPRWGVVKGGLLNPKEMMDNRLGGIVNLNRPDAVKALEQQNLNPFVFQTLETLKQNKEETSGISALSMGMDKNAISTQNSAALVDNLVSLSGVRQKVIARNFAQFLTELYLEVYRLCLINMKKQDVVEIAGNWAPVNANDWVERRVCRVALHIGYGEMDQQAAKMTQAYAGLTQDPGMSNMFTDQNRYNMATDIMKKNRFENFSAYLTSPDKVPPKQPDPLKVQELQIKDKQANASMVTAQATALKHERTATVAAEKETISELKVHIQTLFDKLESDRMDAETTNRINVSQREMHLAEKYPPKPAKEPSTGA